ncbi:uncharacterized protein LOC144619628 [Crassostrea virginica]
MEGYLSERKLLDHMGTSTNAEVCLQHNLSLHGEIVHKLGATTRWTDGEIVGAEIIQGMHGLLTVRGMNGDVFGKRGDSGSIVFREMFFGREKKLEVVAMLHSGDFMPQTCRMEDSRFNVEIMKPHHKIVAHPLNIQEDEFLTRDISEILINRNNNTRVKSI